MVERSPRRRRRFPFFLRTHPASGPRLRIRLHALPRARGRGLQHRQVRRLRHRRLLRPRSPHPRRRARLAHALFPRPRRPPGMVPRPPAHHLEVWRHRPARHRLDPSRKLRRQRSLPPRRLGSSRPRRGRAPPALPGRSHGGRAARGVFPHRKRRDRRSRLPRRPATRHLRPRPRAHRDLPRPDALAPPRRSAPRDALPPLQHHPPALRRRARPPRPRPRPRPRVHRLPRPPGLPPPADSNRKPASPTIPPPRGSSSPRRVSPAEKAFANSS